MAQLVPITDPRKRASIMKPEDKTVHGQGYHGFRHRADCRWFRAHFMSRRVVLERPIAPASSDSPPFFYQVLQRYNGWTQALSHITEANLSLVREFCSSLQPVGAELSWDFVSYVRGVEVRLTPAVLTDMLGVPSLEDFECPFGNVDEGPSQQVVGRTLTGDPSFVWAEGEQLPKNLFTEEYQLLTMMVNASLLPTTYRHAIDYVYAKTVFALGTGMRVSLPHWIIDTIYHTSFTSDQVKSLKWGGVITRLCRAAGVEERDSDERRYPGQPFGEASVRRSVGQYQKSTRTPVTHQGQSSHAGPSSPPPSLQHLLEEMHEIKDRLTIISGHLAHIDQRLDIMAQPPPFPGPYYPTPSPSHHSEQHHSTAPQPEENPAPTEIVPVPVTVPFAPASGTSASSTRSFRVAPSHEVHEVDSQALTPSPPSRPPPTRRSIRLSGKPKQRY